MEQYYWFEKSLTETDRNSKFVVPIDWLGKLLPSDLNPGAEEEVHAVDESGKEYLFRLKVRSLPDELKRPGRNATQDYHPKPELMAKEWKAFVAEKRLQVGDKVYFWRDMRMRSGHIRVKVRVSPRPLTIFGSTFLC